MKIMIGDVNESELPSHDWTIRKIRYWYDRHERMWCINLCDSELTPVDCIRTIRSELESTLKELCETYNVVDCLKY